MRKRLQNRVAESRFALPIMLVYSILVWMANGALTEALYGQFVIFAVSAFMMMTLNNSNALIRIYSRMVSCTFVMLACAATFLFSSSGAAVVQALFILFYLSLFRSYQDKRASGIAFYSFVCIGIASLWFVQILFYVPFLWILMATNIMAISHKMFWASVLGVLAPYWFVGAYSFYAGTADELLYGISEIAVFQPLFCYDGIDVHKLLTFALVAALSIVGIVHFLRNSYLDKIRTRMLYETFIAVDVLTIVFIVLQPQHFDMLLPLMTVNTSCLFAHYVALTRTRTTNVVCIVAFLLTVALTIFNTVS